MDAPTGPWKSLPTGATIVCTFGLVLILVAAVRPLIQRSGTTEVA